MSRTPVRESLILLAEEGLVQVFPQVGSFVSRVDPDRVATPSSSGRPSSSRRSTTCRPEPDPEVVAELRENLDEQQAPGIDLEEFFGLDEAFHHGLLRLSGHERAWSTVVPRRATSTGRAGWGSRRPRRHRSPRSTSRSSRRSSTATSPRARATMRSHLRAVFEDIERIRLRSPELFASDAGSVPVRRNVVVWE